MIDDSINGSYDYTPPGPLAPVGLLAKVNSDTQVTLSWTPSGTDTIGYQIGYSIGHEPPANCKSAIFIGRSQIVGHSHIISGLTPGTNHSFRLCAVSANGGVTVGEATTSLTVDSMSLIDVGDTHVCSANKLGELRCWGQGREGQLAHARHNHHIPFKILGLTDFKSIAAGGSTSCVVLAEAGNIKCWGRGNEGNLGDGTTTESIAPVDVIGLSTGMKQVAVGSVHACAVHDSGRVSCWGKGDLGALGDNDTSAHIRSSPFLVPAINNAESVSVSYSHSCALLKTGEVKCWGYGTLGQLGDGLNLDTGTPVTPTGLDSGVVQIDTGRGRSCAVLIDGSLRCWGDGSSGLLGDGNVGIHTALIPTQVAGVANVKSVSLGYSHSCLLTTEGGVKCWGSGTFGALGNGGTSTTGLLSDVSGLIAGAKSVSAGQYATCARLHSGVLKCWGSPGWGLLGNNNIVENQLVPQTTLTAGSCIGTISVDSGIGTFKVPINSNCSEITIKAWGGAGAIPLFSSTVGGGGGYASSVIAVAGGESYVLEPGLGGFVSGGGSGPYSGGNSGAFQDGQIGAGSMAFGTGAASHGGAYVGGQGFYGGGGGSASNDGASEGGGGGAASVVTAISGGLEIIIAGGGGGAGGNTAASSGGQGGPGCGQPGITGLANLKGGGGGGGGCVGTIITPALASGVPANSNQLPGALAAGTFGGRGVIIIETR